MKPRNFLGILSRRKWISLFLLGSVIGRARGNGRRLADAGQPVIATLAPSTNDSAILPIRLSQFTVLQDPFGTIALYFSNHRYPIVINRGNGDDFYAMDPTCTHAGCQVNNYSVFTGAMNCDCHGSTYDIRGRVTGGPAEADLTAFRTEFDGTDLVEVELPGVPLRIDSVTVQERTVSNTRLKLQFPATEGCKYQLRYYPDLAAAPAPALFAASETGIADQSSYVAPYAFNGPVDIWADAPGARGFFAIEMVLATQIPL